MRLQLEQELSVLQWTAWAQQQIAYWPDTDDPGEWDTQAALAAVITDCRTATAQ